MGDVARENHRVVRPTRWRRRQPVYAHQLNELVDAVSKLQGGVASPQQIYARGAGLAVPPRQFKVTEGAGDYLIVESLFGPSEAAGAGDVFYVAKPWLLRRGPFDGKTRDGIAYAYTSDVERTATDADGDTEDQEVVPGYVVGDRILAVRAVTGGTGVSIDRGESVFQVQWEDMNNDSRAWAAI